MSHLVPSLYQTLSHETSKECLCAQHRANEPKKQVNEIMMERQCWDFNFLLMSWEPKGTPPMPPPPENKALLRPN